jgi:hypothetical protein
MTLQDKFGDMAYDEPVKITVKGEELELDMGVDDIVPLMSMGGSEGDIAEEDIDQLVETLRTALYRQYLPYYDQVRDKEPDNLADNRKEENQEVKEFIDGLLRNELPTVINELVKSLGFADEEDLDGDFPGR